MPKWMLKQAAVNINDLALSWQINPILTHILAVRGFREKADVDYFLQAHRENLTSPFLFADMTKAVVIIEAAIAAQQKIVIFGDYDADGITSTVIIYKTLKSLNAQCSYYIPMREEEGYGLNNQAIAKLKEQGIDLLIACDNGVSSLEQVAYARSLGMQVIIVDHHDLPRDAEDRQILVEAEAVVNAKREDCPYPFKQYCAAGLSYRLAQALYEHFAADWAAFWPQILPFAVIGTICDLVDLLADNRAIVRQGLSLVNNSDNYGLQALCKVCSLENCDLEAYQIGFRLGPCINASGRLDAAKSAVDLFLADNESDAKEMAEKLYQLNQERKQLTDLGIKNALAEIENQQIGEEKVIVIHCPNIHESIAGIIAGKIKELYYRPSIIISGEKAILRGSCRSIEGYNIYEALSKCKHLFENFGGHPMAAGFSISVDNLDILRKTLNQDCLISDDDLEQLYRIDYYLPAEKADLNLAKQIKLLEPYGKANPQIIFAAKNLQLQKIILLGQNKQVMRLIFKNSSRQIEAISFNGKDKLQELINQNCGQHVWPDLIMGVQPKQAINLDIIYNLTVNQFNRQVNAQLVLVDFRMA